MSAQTRTVTTASACAAVMIATQVAGKTARDALFLANFAISALPVVLVASALLSIGAVLITAHWVALAGPKRVIPPFFAVSGLLLVGEWLLATTDLRLAAVVVYLHVAVIGSILISGFWSIINECFDPRTARQGIGRIVGGATAGGLLGGLLAERVGALLGILWVLPVVAVLQLVCARLLILLPTHHEVASPSPRHLFARGGPRLAGESGFRALRRVPYLRNLALIVLLGNAAATLVDFQFKAQATTRFASSAELVRFFAVFYTAVSLVTLVVQAGLTRRLIERIGIARTMMIRPAIMTAGGLAVAPFLNLFGLGFLRSLEAIIQGSIHRSGYELLFSPVVPEDRRSTKTIIDVGADRAGDVVGGLLVKAVIFLPVAVSGHVLLVMTAAISGACLLVSRALRTGYVRALEASLIDRANVLDLGAGMVPATPTMMDSLAGIDMTMTLAGLEHSELRRLAPAPPSRRSEGDDDPPDDSPPPGARSPSRPADAEVAALIELRSGDAARVRAQLRRLSDVTPLLAGQVASLLAWDHVTTWASRTLARAAPAITGQLVDRLLDPDEDFAIRRRIPRILATCATTRARDGLLAALDDGRFEVRFQAGVALTSLRAREPSLPVDAGVVHRAVLRESRVDRRLWADQRLLDDVPADIPGAVVEPSLRSGSNRSLEHVFTLLSLILPPVPLQISFKGLLTRDAVLRGTSLEYLQSVLPREVWDGLSPYLGDAAPGEAAPRSREAVLEDLLRSRQTIEMNLDDLRRRVGEA